MNLTTHPVAPEEIMAWLDGELSSAEARTVAAHVDDCVECANLAAQFRSTTQALSSWTVPPAPSYLENSIVELTQQKSSGQRLPKQKLIVRPSFWTWKQWTLGAGCAAILLLLVISLSIPTVGSLSYRMATKPRMLNFIEPRTASVPIPQQQPISPDATTAYGYTGGQLSPPPPPPPAMAKKTDRAMIEDAETRATLRDAVPSSTAGGGGGAPGPSTSAPMIARTVSLTITVKDFVAARASLDSILARHHGYSAQLTVSTPENSSRSFQASLRIPAPELAAALAELRSLGRVQNESQSGEEITQQHTDLLARLKNSRETESRLQAILQQRTGKVADILEVEEQIERVRGEIESMEAEQKTLEHRVDFASVDLQLTEEFKAQFNSPDTSASTRIHNAFIAGLDHATATLLGFVLFFEEDGPVILIWLVIFGVPSFLVWRRYRKVRGQF
jgi:hypothetical protein